MNIAFIYADVIGMAYSGDLKSYGPEKGIGGSTPPIGTITHFAHRNGQGFGNETATE